MMTNSFTKILVVDDDDKIRSMVSQMLSRMGYEVLSTDSGEHGWSLFMKNHFHLVLTDIEMPGMDGWALTHQIKEISPDTPVMLMTGDDGYDILNKFEHDPADQLLIKPFRYEEIVNAIQLGRLSILQP